MIYSVLKNNRYTKNLTAENAAKFILRESDFEYEVVKTREGFNNYFWILKKKGEKNTNYKYLTPVTADGSKEEEEKFFLHQVLMRASTDWGALVILNKGVQLFGAYGIWCLNRRIGEEYLVETFSSFNSASKELLHYEYETDTFYDPHIKYCRNLITDMWTTEI